LLQENWSPTARLAAGSAGAALLAACLAKRTPEAILLGAVGFGLAVRAVTNLSANRLASRLTGQALGRCGRDGHTKGQRRTTTHAPADEVFVG
jgi:uncharacterized membrane protein